jgi:hypothetical protein
MDKLIYGLYIDKNSRKQFFGSQNDSKNTKERQLKI